MNVSILSPNLKVNPFELFVMNDQARPVRWNRSFIGCFVCGAIGLAFVHDSFRFSGLVIFLLLKSMYGRLKSPFLERGDLVPLSFLVMLFPCCSYVFWRSVVLALERQERGEAPELFGER